MSRTARVRRVDLVFGLVAGAQQFLVEGLAVGQIGQGVGHGVAADLFQVLAQTGDLLGRGLQRLLEGCVLRWTRGWRSSGR